MLVVNLSEVLVNGSIGKVKDYVDGKIIVHFPKSDITVPISQYVFTKVDPVSRKTLAKRSQFPLILSFGITIHKSQGMSLESVVVDCEDANIPGQLGVALGRARTAENLQVKNFSPHLVKKHPKQVYDFYSSTSKTFISDCSGCKNEFISIGVLNDLFIPVDWNLTTDFFDAEIIDDFDTAEDNDPGFFIDNLDDIFITEENVNGPSPIPEHISPGEILNEIKEEYIGTPLEEKMSVVIEDVKHNISVFSLWFTSIFLCLNKISSETFSDCELSQHKHVMSFCTKVNSYLMSKSYFDSCKKVISEIKNYTSDLGFSLFTATVFKIQNVILKIQSNIVATSDIQERSIPTEHSEEGKGVIRYIGGYCIAKVKFKYQKWSKIPYLNHQGRLFLKIAGKKLIFYLR